MGWGHNLLGWGHSVKVTMNSERFVIVRTKKCSSIDGGSNDVAVDLMSLVDLMSRDLMS